ncbi:hypothetical protein TNCV_491551 [Trichonephila clavipes]|nr:hypothetical protein TNCV_491551 [Trichonephila clavipes]
MMDLMSRLKTVRPASKNFKTGLRLPSGQGIGSRQACHEFEPSTTTRLVGQRSKLNLSRAETSPVRVMR